MIEKPVWKKTNKIEKPGMYLYGGKGEKPGQLARPLIYKLPVDWEEYFWLAYLGPIPEPEMPRPDLRIDDPVIVWDYPDGGRYRRHFAGWTPDGRIKAWNNGTSWTTEHVTIWNNYRLPTEDELKTTPQP